MDLLLVEYGKPQIQFVLDFRRALRVFQLHFCNELIEVFVQSFYFPL